MSLARTHKGWENEHLATFLLSRIAFVASPVTVADDIGTDLFCTLFERLDRDGTPLLLPRSSIAVQVKSSPEPVDVAPKLGYLARLEVPYYLGIVDQAALTLTLYSARFLPCLLSFRGSHKRLDLVPVEEFVRDYRPGSDEAGYKLLCPKVTTLAATTNTADVATAARALQEDAAAALKALVSRMNKEYVFDIPGGHVEIYMGRDSARTFRESFFKRLAEALLNLAWLLQAGQQVSDAELDAYLAIPEALAATNQIPPYVAHGRDVLLAARSAVRLTQR